MSNAPEKALVIGGGSDIGGAITRELDGAGYSVVSTYFQSEDQAIDLPGAIQQCDLRDLEQIDRVMQFVGDRLDVLVTAAMPFLEGGSLDFEEYQKIEAILRGHVYAMCEAAKKKHAESLRVFHMLGQCVERGLPGAAHYSGAFAYLDNLGGSINGKEGKVGEVEVCNFRLGPVDTREWDGLSDEIRQRYEEKVRAFIQPEEVARHVRHLLSQRVMPSTFKLDGYYGN